MRGCEICGATGYHLDDCPRADRFEVSKKRVCALCGEEIEDKDYVITFDATEAVIHADCAADARYRFGLTQVFDKLGIEYYDGTGRDVNE